MTTSTKKTAQIASSEVTGEPSRFLLAVDKDKITGPIESRLYDLDRLSAKHYKEIKKRPNVDVYELDGEELAGILANYYEQTSSE